MAASLTAPNVWAAAPTTELEACDQALEAGDKAIESLMKLTQEQEGLMYSMKQGLLLRQEYIEQLESQTGAWYHNPFITIPVGMVVGALSAAYLIRK